MSSSSWFCRRNPELLIPRTNVSIGMDDVTEILQNMTNVCVNPCSLRRSAEHLDDSEEGQIRLHGYCDIGRGSLKQISFCLICKLISIPHFLSLNQGREYKTKITSVQIHCFKFVWKAGLSYRESGFSLLVMLCYYSPNVLGLLHDFQSQ